MEKEKEADVLLIEDNLDDSELTLYSLMSVNDNLKYQHFTNGEDALEYVFKHKTYWGQPAKDHLKLIIIDLKLPGMYGLEIVKRLKESELTRNIPVVVLSASTDINDIHIAYRVGVNSYVVKPERFEGYLRKIGSLASYWSSVNERPTTSV